ncbi:MAG: hypothetical protein NVSMB64_09410 [Candidatus Velthaea sp.]
MRPTIELDGATLRANVRAFAALGAPVAAVVKNNGYNWGVGTLVREIDALVESYVVADDAEFWALRVHTRKPIRLLADVAPARMAALLAKDAIPNVSTREGLAAARRAVVRVGIIDAAGWNGIPARDAGDFARACAAGDVAVELWSHITSAERCAQIEAAFDAAIAAFYAAGVRVVSTDLASTAWASQARSRDRLRVGAGLFGARLGSAANATCALRVVAPMVRWFAAGAIGWSGYGEVRVPAHRGVAVVRCGDGDGFPKVLAGDDDILSVGMQYTARLADQPADLHTLIGASTDLDTLARRAGMTPHEIVVGLAQR